MTVSLETLSDTELHKRVEDEFAWDPAVPSARVGISVTNHSVQLSGTVNTLAERLAAVRAVKRVKGVRAIADDLVVHPIGLYDRSDHDIARVVERALELNTKIPETVHMTVRDGVVTLDGVAEWEYQRRAAANVVHDFAGVRNVVNHIALTPNAAPREVHRRITSAFHRRATLDARSIEVLVDDAEVTLNGVVSNLSERSQAEAAAWAAPGVMMVHNNLRIG